MNYLMTFHTEIKMKKHKRITIALILLLSVSIAGIAQSLPVPDSPEDWVNDYAKVFNKSEKEQLSRKLNLFEYNTSTQIYVVTVKDSEGYPVSTLAPMIGEKTLLELLEDAIRKEFFSRKFLVGLNNAITGKLDSL